MFLASMAKRILLVIAVLFIAIQFIRPRRNTDPRPPGKDDFIVHYQPPPAVARTLQNACYDCHSNNTRYPWYAQIQPTAWWLKGHIDEGKEELNFSEFGTYSAKDKGQKLNSISDEVFNRKMPLRSYTWLHADARLSDAQISELSEWVDALHDKISSSD